MPALSPTSDSSSAVLAPLPVRRFTVQEYHHMGRAGVLDEDEGAAAGGSDQPLDVGPADRRCETGRDRHRAAPMSGRRAARSMGRETSCTQHPGGCLAARGEGGITRESATPRSGSRRI